LTISSIYGACVAAWGGCEVKELPTMKKKVLAGVALAVALILPARAATPDTRVPAGMYQLADARMADARWHFECRPLIRNGLVYSFDIRDGHANFDGDDKALTGGFAEVNYGIPYLKFAKWNGGYFTSGGSQMTIMDNSKAYVCE
jgi:hypothetical protein